MPHIQFKPFPLLETQRLNLRPLNQEDIPVIFQLHSDKNNTKYIDRKLPEELEESQAFFHKITNGINENKWIFWALESKELNKFIGTVCLWNFSEDRHQAEIGFELEVKSQGRGYMTETLAAVLDYGFKQLQLHKIKGYAHAKNTASINLMEKVGFNYLETILEKSSKTGSIEPMTVFGINKPTHD